MDKDDYTQALDYANSLLAAYYHTMRSCRAVKANTAIRKDLETALDAMAAVYQTIGRESIKHDKKPKRNRK